MKTLYTLKDVSIKLKRHYITIWKWQKAGKIKPAFKTPKGMCLFTKEEIAKAKGL